jgi:hypothetical protein
MNRTTPGATLVSLLLCLTCCSTGNGSEHAAKVHTSPIAGSWYPKDPRELRSLLESSLAKAPAPDPAEAQRLIAVVVPHAGYAYSGFTAAHAYRWIGRRRPGRVLMLGPSHYADFRGLSLGDYQSYETPLGRVPVDRRGAKILNECPLVGFRPEAHSQEHSLDIQLPFLQVLFPASPPSILPLLVGHLEEEDYPRIAQCIREVLDPETVLVVSSDFTHYGPRFGYVPFPHGEGIEEEIRSLDQGAFDRIFDLDRPGFLAYHGATGITVCGLRPIALLLDLLPEGTRPKSLYYTTSGRLTGDYRNSVSYGSLAFTRDALWATEAAEKGTGSKGEATMKKKKTRTHAAVVEEPALTAAEKATLLRLARDTVEGHVRSGSTPDPLGGAYAITPALRAHRGAFVTLKSHGNLRGCIGHIQPLEPLYEAVRENAVNAASRDSRFRPVRPDELPDIEIEISVLTPPRPVSSHRDIVLGRHGIILKKGPRQAVFLPQVAPEQGWDLPETLRHLSLKAGLPGADWLDAETEFQVFTAEVFEEH